MSFRVTTGVWLGTVCGPSPPDKLLFFEKCEAEAGQAAEGSLPPAAGLEVASHLGAIFGVLGSGAVAPHLRPAPKQFPPRTSFSLLSYFPRCLSQFSFYLCLRSFFLRKNG